MNDSDPKAELERLHKRVAELESQVHSIQPTTWKREQVPFYPTYLAWSGAILGMIGAVGSLLVNVIGSLAVGQHPLKLIQVYLTFPLGEKALAEGLDTGIVVAIGCCLYILTGAVLAVPLQLILVRFFAGADVKVRLGVGTIAGLLLWLVNFYVLIAWLQPVLFHGNWIVEQVPPLIGALTHLVFAWIVAILSPWGTFERRPDATTVAVASGRPDDQVERTNPA